MNRETFVEKLRTGLRGLPQTTVDEVMADYEAHFSEGLQAGRTEDEIASALGDPSRLARELRADGHDLPRKGDMVGLGWPEAALHPFDRDSGLRLPQP